MKTFQFKANIEFQADDLDDAWRQLALHFLLLSQGYTGDGHAAPPSLDHIGVLDLNLVRSERERER